jgi:hypothetical protein
MSKQPSLRCWHELFNRKSQTEDRKCRMGGEGFEPPTLSV